MEAVAHTTVALTAPQVRASDQQREEEGEGLLSLLKNKSQRTDTLNYMPIQSC